MSPDPPVLDYRRREPLLRQPAPHASAGDILVFIVAGGLGFGIFCIVGVGTLQQVRSPALIRTFGMAFAILGIAALICGVIIESRRRFFLAGLLVGCGLAIAIFGCILFMASYAVV